MKLSNSFKKIIRSSWFKPVLKQSTISILAIIGLVISSVAFAKTINFSGNLDMNGNGIANVSGQQALRFRDGQAFVTVHDGQGNFNILSGIDNNNTIVSSDGGARMEWNDNGWVDIEIYSGSSGNSGSLAASYYFNSSGMDFGGSDLTSVGTLESDSYSGSGCDLAEYYKIEDPDKSKIHKGEIVSLSSAGETIKKADKQRDGSVVGVVSTDPAILLGNTEKVKNNKDNYKPIALVGKVPMKVTTVNGAIEKGDNISSSPTPGYGMKCNDLSKCGGAVVGKAMEELEEGTGTIKMLVKHGF